MTAGFLKRALLPLLLLGLLAAPAAAEGFLASIDDVPLMPGLSEKPQDGLLFDAPSGRIAEAKAEGAVTPEKILSFYAATLPSLGWEKVPAADRSAVTWRRDTEMLTVQVTPAGRRSTVHFRIAPE